MQAKSSAESRIKAIAIQAIEAFQVSKEFHDKKVQFATNTYVTRKQNFQNRVAIQYPKLSLDFQDEN